MSRTMTLPLAAGVIALAGACMSAATAQSLPAPAQRPAPVHTVTGGLLSPLSLDVAPDGTRYFTQNFTGTLQVKKPGRPARVLYQNKAGAEVGAVSVRAGRVRFAVTDAKGRTSLMGLGRHGRAYRIADLSGFEKRHNPDRSTTYGFRGLAVACAAQFPDKSPATYPGIVESHPYATVQAAGGTTYVADAAANTILAVRPGGRVRTVAVLPPSALRATAGYVESTGLPSCAIGRTSHFEGVPTDVEIGPRGSLYVSTLPGGPEDASLGAGASVYKVNPRTGGVAKLAGGLLSATGLAVSPTGSVYVAELFGGRIVRIAAGSRALRTYARVTMPGDVEWTTRGVFATVNVLTGLSGEPGDVPRGAVVRFGPR